MQVRCPACQAVHDVPPDKAGTPGLRCRCRCGNVFPVVPPPAAAQTGPPPAAAAKPSAPGAPPARPAAPAAAVPPRPVQPAAPPPAPLTPARPVPAPAVAPKAAAPATPAAAARTAAPGPAAGTSAAAAAERPLPGPAWKRCSRHPSKPSTCVCRSCGKAFCFDCEQRVQTVLVCPECESLCVPASTYLAAQERDRQRARSLFQELPDIVAYPLCDRMAFVLLAIVTGVFGVMTRIAAYSGMGAAQAAGVLLSTGILTWYAFTAAARVSSGNRTSYMPEFGDVTDIANALKLAGGAMLISMAPLVLALVLLGVDAWQMMPGSTRQDAVSEAMAGLESPAPGATPDALADLLADPEGDGSEEADPEAAPEAPVPHEEAAPEGPGAGTLLLHLGLLGLAAVWALLYTPVALTVAAVTRSLWQTLNPLLGVATIVRMGSTYWQVAGIYLVIVIVAGTLTFVISLIPVAGYFLRAFVDAYAYLMVGCLIGLGIEKRAKELDLE